MVIINALDLGDDEANDSDLAVKRRGQKAIVWYFLNPIVEKM